VEEAFEMVGAANVEERLPIIESIILTRQIYRVQEKVEKTSERLKRTERGWKELGEGGEIRVSVERAEKGWREQREGGKNIECLERAERVVRTERGWRKQREGVE